MGCRNRLGILGRSRYGRSVLADLFRQGVDPHQYTASLLLGVTLDQFRELPADEQKNYRQRAKAVNFGVPGGLGAASLVTYAKQTYGVVMGFDEAKAFRKRLIREIYPELTPYLNDNQYVGIAENLKCRPEQVRRAFGNRNQLSLAFSIVCGDTESPNGDTYEQDLVEHIWLALARLNGNAVLESAIQNREPSYTLARRIFYGHTATLSGRVRGHVSFPQRMNSPFQGLAADGNKLALFRLLRAGHQVCGFIHDEMLILIPDRSDYDVHVAQVEQILIDSMRELCPDIPIATEFLLGDRWYKDVDDQPCDAAGRIVPYTAVPAEQSALQPEIDAIWKDA